MTDINLSSVTPLVLGSKTDPKVPITTSKHVYMGTGETIDDKLKNVDNELKDIEFKCPHCGEVITLKVMKKLLKEKPEPPREEWDEDLVKLRLNSPDSDD